MKPVLSDERVRMAVIDELNREPDVFARHISVTAVDGAVTLGGHVLTLHAKHTAVRAAKRVRGVGAVADEIDVRPTDLGWRGNDEIAEDIARLRTWNTQIPDSVEVEVNDGRVYLSGWVESAERRATAEAAISHVAGVREVGNFIRVDLSVDEHGPNHRETT